MTDALFTVDDHQKLTLETSSRRFLGLAVGRFYVFLAFGASTTVPNIVWRKFVTIRPWWPPVRELRGFMSLEHEREFMRYLSKGVE